MNILVFDTASAVISLALSGPEGAHFLESDTGMRHAEVLLDMADSLLHAAGLGARDLELTGCMRGPGSFTGLRIGFAAAKALSLSLGIPLVSIPTLDCMAASLAAQPGLAVPVIDAKQGRFFAALYRRGERLSPYLDESPDSLAARLAETGDPILLTGPDAPLLKARLGSFGDRVAVDSAHRQGRARELLEAVRAGYPANGADGPDDGPLYLRKSDAELKLITGSAV